MAWKLKIMLNLAFNDCSIINADYISFPHERVPKCLHFIFWSQFWNIKPERIMDTFCHFSSLIWPIYFDFLFILYQIVSLKLTYHWTCHANTDFFYYKSSGLLPTIRKHNALMLSELQTDINLWLLVRLPCVIHHWKGLLNQIQVNHISSLNLKSESLHLPLANSISS